MNKLALIKLLEIRGVYGLEKGQSVGQAIRETGGEATYDELLEVIRKCAIHQEDILDACKRKKEELELQVKKLQEENANMFEDIMWLRCLEAAGVDNWEGHDIAVDMYEEQMGSEED